jgi:pyruvate dehydrogenase E1 component alpha subunit
MMAEIIGREDGYCRGRGGSMHITAIDKGMLGADAIVAGSSAIAVGAAHGLRLQGRDGVVLCFFGDGAANQGILHEACNLGAVLSAPAVFVCENNEWAISTPAAASTRITNIADRAVGYGIPGVVTDGNDVLGVRAVTSEAVARARAGEGPTLIEAKSYRVTPHSAATKTDLRPVEELDAWRARDPILGFSRHLAEEHGLEPARLEQIEEQARRDVEEAVEFALASPRPEPEAALEDVYAPADWLAPGRLA